MDGMGCILAYFVADYVFQDSKTYADSLRGPTLGGVKEIGECGMSTMDYEKSQLPHIWIVVFIVGFIGMILGITVGIVYYFKSQLSIQDQQSQGRYGKTRELRQLNDWETSFLNREKDGKVSIDHAITITLRRYNP